MRVLLDDIVESQFDLDNLLNRYSYLYETLPVTSKQSIDEKSTRLFKLMSHVLQKGYISTKDLQKSIDFDKCAPEWLQVYSELYNIPIPRFPEYNQLRTHTQTVTQVGTAMTTVATHRLAINDYNVEIYIYGGISVTPRQIYDAPNLVIESHQISFDNGLTDSATYDIVYTYKRNYDRASRLICKNITQLDDMRSTFKGMEFYLRLLFHNEIDITITAQEKLYPYFQFCRLEGGVPRGDGSTIIPTVPLVTGDFFRYFISKRAATGFGYTRNPTPNNGANNGVTNPRLVDPVVLSTLSDQDATPRLITDSGVIYSDPSSIVFDIDADLHTYVSTDNYITKFVKDTIVNYFFPFPNIYSNYVTFNFTNHINPW